MKELMSKKQMDNLSGGKTDEKKEILLINYGQQGGKTKR